MYPIPPLSNEEINKLNNWGRNRPKPIIDRVLEAAKKEPALFVQLKQVANMEEFQKGLAIAAEVFNSEYTAGNEVPHLFAYNQASKAAIVRFGQIIFEVFNTQLNTETGEDSTSDYAPDEDMDFKVL